uniref:Uncharacterized protein n=1 Tax=Acinetobacter phage vB_Ab_1137_KEN_05 TaxID=3143020 RepID=A0AAU8KVX4_9VIRU
MYVIYIQEVLAFERRTYNWFILFNVCGVVCIRVVS